MEVDESAAIKTPVYLERNHRVMKRVRRHLVQAEEQKDQAGEVVFKHGLTFRQLPQINTI